jgi:hypothetical protein
MNSNFISVDKMAAMSDSKKKIVEKLLNTTRTDDVTNDNVSMEINKLPDDIIDKIVCNYVNLLPSKYVLRDWVNKDKLNWKMLSENPCAIELLKERIEYEKSLDKEEYEKLGDDNRVNWLKLSINPEAIDILKKYPNDIVWCGLCDNKNPRAVEMIIERIEYEKHLPPFHFDQDVDEYGLYRIWWDRMGYNEHPQIIEMLKEKIELEKNKEYYATLNMNDIIDWYQICSNPHPNAIELLKANPEKIDWEILSENPGAIELLKANPEKIDWKILSGNPNAIELLKANPKNIDWFVLSGNPNAIELLKANPKNIAWLMLSKNPNAIELLKANPKKILWDVLSDNENALELIKARHKYELSLSQEEYSKLLFPRHSYKKLDWKILSANKCIFEMV